MMLEEDGENTVDSISKMFTTFDDIVGVDTMYCLDEDLHLLKEKNISGSNKYLEQVLNVLQSSKNINARFYSKPFHTYTLLNENGLILISKVNINNGVYLVVIGGENEPVDLISLLKTVKEIRKGSSN